MFLRAPKRIQKKILTEGRKAHEKWVKQQEYAQKRKLNPKNEYEKMLSARKPKVLSKAASDILSANVALVSGAEFGTTSEKLAENVRLLEH
jgi:hypothetical protein